jgi:hypothetical protein
VKSVTGNSAMAAATSTAVSIRLVALPALRDLLFSAKHLFVAAMDGKSPSLDGPGQVGRADRQGQYDTQSPTGSAANADHIN